MPRRARTSSTRKLATTVGTSSPSAPSTTTHWPRSATASSTSARARRLGRSGTSSMAVAALGQPRRRGAQDLVFSEAPPQLLGRILPFTVGGRRRQQRPRLEQQELRAELQKLREGLQLSFQGEHLLQVLVRHRGEAERGHVQAALLDQAVEEIEGAIKLRQRNRERAHRPPPR